MLACLDKGCFPTSLKKFAVAHAVVAEGVTETPDFGDDAVGGHGTLFKEWK